MAISRLTTSRARLLAILLAVMMPVALIMWAAAYTNYRFTAQSIERDYALLTANYTSRIRVWLRGSERALATMVAGIGAIAANREECASAARSIVHSVPGYRAVYVSVAPGAACKAVLPGLPVLEQRMDMLVDAASKGMRYEATGDRIAETRLLFAPENNQGMVMHIKVDAKDGRPASSAILVIDPAVLSTTMAFGEHYPGATVAAVLADGTVVASTGEQAGSDAWRPEVRNYGADLRRWDGPGTDGVARLYASRPVIGDQLYVVGGFSPSDHARAWNQFLLLMAMPALVIIALTLAFLRAIDVYVVHWLKRLEWTARERSQLREARVEIADNMPSEIKSFAGAFNAMADAEAARRASLEAALEENRFLVRELHHRVKNSLQVIQSYLALRRRGQSGPSREALLDAETRVQVLSLAYRIALADGVVRDVDLGTFLGQMIHTAANNTFSREQVAVLDPPSRPATMELERVIALGFLLSDLFLRAALSAPAFSLRLVLGEDGRDVTLKVFGDRPIELGDAPRINRGLQLQLGAQAIAPDPETGLLAGWRWAAPVAPDQAQSSDKAS